MAVGYFYCKMINLILCTYGNFASKPPSAQYECVDLYGPPCKVLDLKRKKINTTPASCLLFYKMIIGIF